MVGVGLRAAAVLVVLAAAVGVHATSERLVAPVGSEASIVTSDVESWGVSFSFAHVRVCTQFVVGVAASLVATIWRMGGVDEANLLPSRRLFLASRCCLASGLATK